MDLQERGNPTWRPSSLGREVCQSTVPKRQTEILFVGFRLIRHGTTRLTNFLRSGLASGAMVGALFGGFLNDYTSWGWRMAFLIQVLPSFLSAIIVYSLIKVPPKQSDKSYVKRIDFGGVFLVSSFLAALVLGLSSGGNIVPWLHPLPIAAISLSILLF